MADAKVLQTIDEMMDESLDELRALLKMPSMALKRDEIDSISSHLVSVLADKGFAAKVVPTSGCPVVYAEMNVGAKRTLMFYNHYDVQPPEPLEEWKSPPFEPTEHDGRLYARGAADNKSNIVARLTAVEAYARAGKLPVNVKFVIEGEEEIGSLHLGEFVESNPDLMAADACLWEGSYKDEMGRYRLWCGVKGICYVHFEAKGARDDLHSAIATSVISPAWRLTWALASLKDKDERILIDGFYDDVLEPTERDIEVLENIPMDEAQRLQLLGIDSFLDNKTGRDLKVQDYYSPTCNICGIVSGYTGEASKTVLPARAQANVDFRLVPNQDPQDIRQKLRKHLDKHGFQDVEISGTEGYRPARTPITDPFVQEVVTASERVYGQNPVIEPTIGGSGPMYLFSEEMSCVSMGIGDVRSRIHAPNESISLHDYRDGVRFIAELIDVFGQAEG